MLKITKLLLLGIYSVSFLMILVLQIRSSILKSGFMYDSLIYWYLFFGLIYYIYHYGKNSSFSLAVALISFMIASASGIIGLTGIGEVLMRVMLILLIIGIFQAVWEFKTLESDN